MSTDETPSRATRWRRFVGNFTIVQAAELTLAAVLVAVTICQAYLAHRANETALDAIALADRTAHLELRAYVNTIKAEAFGITDSRKVTVRITAKNSGQTPAMYATVKNLFVYWEAIPKPPPIAGAMPVKEDIPATIAPGDFIYIERTIDRAKLADLQAGTLALHATGDIEYFDIYGQGHSTEFHFVQGGEYDYRASQMGLDRHGNSSN